MTNSDIWPKISVTDPVGIKEDIPFSTSCQNTNTIYCHQESYIYFIFVGFILPKCPLLHYRIIPVRHTSLHSCWVQL